MPIQSHTKKDGYRTYVGKSGVPYASVTTILSAVEDKWWLKKFKENNPDSSEISNHYATMGTRIHFLNEQLLNDGTVDFSKLENNDKVSEDAFKEIVARHEVFKPFLSLVKPISIEEMLVWEQLDSSGLPIGFGGTVDLVGEIADASVLKYQDDPNNSPFEPGEPIVFVADYKNNRAQKSSQDFLKAYCQLSAYAAAKNPSLGNNPIKHGFILSSTCSKVKKIAKLHIFYVDFDKLNFYFSHFYHFLLKFYKQIPKEEASWSNFQKQAVRYYDSGLKKENGKTLWKYEDENYLGVKLILHDESLSSV